MGMLLLGILIFIFAYTVPTIIALYVASWMVLQNDIFGQDHFMIMSQRITRAAYAPVMLIFLLVLFMIKPNGSIM
jgi:hypothetical protein